MKINEKEFDEVFEQFCDNLFYDNAGNYHRLYVIGGHIYYGLEAASETMPECVWDGTATELALMQGASRASWLGDACYIDDNDVLRWAQDDSEVDEQTYSDYLDDTASSGGMRAFLRDDILSKIERA